jgi:hypothetical protein
MQAVFVLLDWLAERVDGYGNTWSTLTRPLKPDASPGARQYRDAVLRELCRIVDERAMRSQLRTRIQRALRLDEAMVDAILWEAPRPLLTSVIPTAIRRLERDWTILDPPGHEAVADGPLPEFVIGRLFGDLHLPEVTIITPPERRDGEEGRTDLPIVLSLTAYAPGRVSHRLTVGNRFARHWVEPPPLDDGEGSLEVATLCDAYTQLDDVVVDGAAVAVVRPTAVRVVQPAEAVLSSSHGELSWHSRVLAPVPGRTADLALARALPGLGDLRWHLHADRREVTVRRWADASEIDVRKPGTEERGTVRFTLDGAPAAVGFDAAVDALSVSVTPPARFDLVDTALVRTLRAERFRAVVVEAPAMARHLNSFDRERLATAIQAALVERAVRDGTDVATTFEHSGAAVLEEVARILDRSGDDAETGRHSARRIADALQDPAVQDALAASIEVLGGQSHEWADWLRERWVATVAALLHQALQDLCPEFDAGEVVPEFVDDEGGVRIWLVETTIGGSGLLQAAAERILDDPDVFVDLVLAGLLPGPQEISATELDRCTALLHEDLDVQDAVAAVRNATDHRAREAAFGTLLATLREAGVFICHPVVAAFSARFLRPGAGVHTDALTSSLLKAWDAVEHDLGVELDLAAFARLQADNAAVDGVIGGRPAGERVRRWRAGQVQGLLWPRGFAARRSSLTVANRFRTVTGADARLVAALRPQGETPYRVDELEPLFAEDGPLATDGSAILHGDLQDPEALRAALLQLATRSVDAGGVLDHARIREVRRLGDTIRATLSLDLVR